MSSKNGERVFPLMPTPAAITAAWITKTTAVPKRLFTAFLCFCLKTVFRLLEFPKTYLRYDLIENKRSRTGWFSLILIMYVLKRKKYTFQILFSSTEVANIQ